MAFAVVLITGVFAPEFVLAQSKEEAQLIVRVQDLENTIRTLNGQIEGLQFQLTQMQQLIQKMQDDNEFRFQQLEGGAGKKTDAATQSGGATPSGALPQDKSSATRTTQSSGDLASPAPLKPSADVGGQVDDLNGQPDDGLGDSQDPLLGKGGEGGESTATLGTLQSTGKAPNFNVDASEPISSGDAEAQYKAGYDAFTRGDYDFAEDQFRQFISLYPKDPHAADATNWLGEALLQRQAYDEAADVLLTGFQNYQTSPRAPDLLLKLGVALAGAGEVDTACRTFFEVSKRYTKQPAAFTQRLQQEKAKAKCPV